MSTLWPILETVFTIIVLGGVGGLAIYMAYRTGHSAGFDNGVRSDATHFYPSPVKNKTRCSAHDCPEKGLCNCYGDDGVD